ncbi:hypothetical protein ACQP0C_37755 [Nocardia sp. CA-129566]|uniref:hypothetical protein n=1 Tax=Nocardia sp. CA-129566 TaxID=3239976 RepID=UPI003D9956DB
MRQQTPARVGRNTALMATAAAVPAMVLSDLVGLSITGAVRWTELAGADWNTHAASRFSPSDTCHPQAWPALVFFKG